VGRGEGGGGREAIGEEAEAVLAATARFHLIGVDREAGDHCHIGVDRMPDRHALVLEDAVVVVDPLPGLARVDKGKGQRADAASRRQLDGLAVRAGDPKRRGRLLPPPPAPPAARHFYKTPPYNLT